ncbi:MAG: DUF3782 domain-containing protein [Methylococcaceae bacterium]|nr:MAG: DUF3782 domain-containing protein [Methylococcaceae bacterium]
MNTTVVDDIWTILREVARMQKETERKFQETDRKMQETDRKMQDTDRKIKEVTAGIGKLGNRLGDFIEDAVRPTAVPLFRQRGIDIHEVQQNVSTQRGEEGIEIDLLVVNDSDVIAIECKSNLKLDDVKEHLERLTKLKRLLPRYADARVMGAMAAMVIPDNVAQYAYRQGLFVIGQSGDHLEIRNDARFTPGIW